jgi:NhaP-type Na+/H+ or K+/H+ antiporter
MNVLLVVGLAVILSFLGGKIVNRLKIPAITGWIVMGIVFGGSVLGVFSDSVLNRVDLISDIALGVIAFGIGRELLISNLRRLGKSIAAIVLCEALGAFFLVMISVFLLTHRLYEALVLAAVSSATAPAATVMVLEETRSRGDLTTTILSVVALDDGIALILYAFASSIAKVLLVHERGLNFRTFLENPALEIFGALLLGGSIGLVLSLVVRRTHHRTDIFALTMGAILVSIGLATHFHLSGLLANMALGITFANLAPRSSRSIASIWEQATPFLYMAFFCLAGAHLNIKLLPQIGLLGLVYTGARMLGKVSGASIGAMVSHAPKVIQKYIGFSLFPQVGVALALAIVVKSDFVSYGIAGKNLALMVINLLLFTTVITEIVGPYLTKWALIKSGEAAKKKI